MGAKSYWIRKRERPSRRTGRSTVDGKTANEMIEEQAEAIRRMSPDELAAYVSAISDQAQAGRADAEEAAAAVTARVSPTVRTSSGALPPSSRLPAFSH